MLQKQTFLLAPKAAQTQDWPRNSALSQLNSFFRQGHAKPVNALSFESARAFNCAVAVSIRLDRSENFHAVADVFTNDAQVVRQRVEIDFGPGRTAGWQGRFIHRLRRLNRFKKSETKKEQEEKNRKSGCLIPFVLFVHFRGLIFFLRNRWMFLRSRSRRD